MNHYLINYKWHFVSVLLILVTLAVLPAVMVLLFGSIVATLGMLFFLKLGAYRQLLWFLALLQIFTFAIKVGYGVANTTILALLPAVYLGIMILCLFILQTQGKIRFRFSILDILVISFFILDFVQIFNPYLAALDDPLFFEIGLRGFQQRSFFGLVYFVIRWLKIPVFRFNTIVRIFTYSTAFGSIYALLQQFFLFTFLESKFRSDQIALDPLLEAQYLARAVGLLGSPYTFGLISATGFVCAIYLLNTVSLSKSEKLIVTACVLLNGAAIVVSGSRSTYLALLVVSAFLIFLMRLSFFSLVRRSLSTICAVVVTLFLLILFFPESVPVEYSIERIKSVSQIFTSDDSLKDNNFKVRRDNIAASESMILSNPFGYGTGIFNGGSNPDGLVSVNGYATFMDNEFVVLALELGIAGVLLFCAITAVALHRCRLALKYQYWRNRSRVLAALIIICPVASVGGQWLAAYPINIIFWAVLGLIAGLPTSVHASQIFETVPDGLLNLKASTEK